MAQFRPPNGMKGIQVQIDLNTLDPYTCPVCTGSQWAETFRILKVSKIQAGTPEDILVEVISFICELCGEPSGLIKSVTQLQRGLKS